MKKTALLLLGTILISGTTYAGGSIFGGGKHKTANPYGVNSINVHVCSSLECPPVRIVEGKCDGAHMSMRWGVCLCDEGYVANGDVCEKETDVDVGVCENGNVYLSYMSDPCATETPMAGRTCTSDIDCDGADDPLAINTGCCDTTLNKCKAWTHHYDKSKDKNIFMCPEDNKACKKNSDCESGEFCNIIATGWDCEKPDTGTCAPIGEVNTHTYLNGTNKTFWTSPNNIQWWGGENWCKAQGKTLISYTTLQDLFECNRNAQNCNWGKFTNASNWQDGESLSDLYWTSESYSSCNAGYLTVRGSRFWGYSRKQSSNALCE